MKNLIYKDLKLAVHPTLFLFLLLDAMLLIPQYPYYVAFMYTCLAVFFTFLNGNQTSDIYYSCLLPVAKGDVVKARVRTVMLFQAVQLLISLPFAWLNHRLYPAGTNAAGIEANVAFYGLVFLMFAGFNLTFLPAFYKTARKLTKPLVGSGIFISFYIVAAEAIAQYIPSPVGTYLDAVGRDAAKDQLPVLIVGAILWILLTVWAEKLSIRRFEEVDL